MPIIERIVNVCCRYAALTALAMTMTVILNPAFLSLWVGNAAFGGLFARVQRRIFR